MGWQDAPAIDPQAQQPQQPAWMSAPAVNQQQSALPPDQQRGMASGLMHSAISGVPIAGPLAEKGISHFYPQNEKLQQDFEERHPYASTAAGVAGGIAATAPFAELAIGRALLGLTAKSLPGMVATGAASGAGISALDAAARGNDPTQAAEIGGIMGGALPVAGRVIGGAITRAGNAIRGPNSALRGAENFEELPTAAVNPNVPNEKVYMTGGQKSGDMKTQQFEQAALRGQMDEGSQRIAEDFKTNTSDPSMAAGRTAVGRTFDPQGQIQADNRFDAGVMVKQGVQDAATEAKQKATNLYNQAYHSDGILNPAGFEGIDNKIKQKLSLPQYLKPGELPEIVNPQTAPQSDAALQWLNHSVAQLRMTNRADPYAGASGLVSNPNSVDMQALDTIRKTLLGYARSAQRDPNDARIMRKIIGQFDNHVEGMISDPLMFRGDPNVLETLKQARLAYGDYRSAFTADRGDMGVGAAMQKIVGLNGHDGASPEQVMNYVIGSGKIGNTELSRQLIGHIKNVLGEGPEWSAIKQAAWKTLTEGGTQKTATSITDFLDKQQSVANTLFKPQEQALMRRYAGIMQQMTPKAGAVNWSGTGGALAVMKSQAGNAIWAMLGAHLAGPVGSVAGLGLNAARVALRDRSQMGQVARSIYLDPATNQASQLFAQQMARYAGVAGRSLTGPIDQSQAQGQAGTQ